MKREISGNIVASNWGVLVTSGGGEASVLLFLILKSQFVKLS